jgi:predicted nucleic acid-binding protein
MPFVSSPGARIKVAADPDDDKFTAAVSGKANFLISGDRALIEESG